MKRSWNVPGELLTEPAACRRRGFRVAAVSAGSDSPAGPLANPNPFDNGHHAMKPTATSISENAINAIWEYVRENRHGMDSERATTMIRELVYSAVCDVNKLLVAETAIVAELQKKIVAMKLAAATGKTNQRKGPKQ